MASKKINIPKNQILWETFFNEDHIPLFFITSDKVRDTYFLYMIDSNKNKLIKQSQNPTKLTEFADEKINTYK